jgi:hypothetical protein
MELTPVAMLQMGTGMYNVLVAFILALFIALGIRSLLLIILGRHPGVLHVLFHLLVGITFLFIGWLYYLFTAPLLVWDRWAMCVATVTVLIILLGVTLRHGRGKPPRSSGIFALLLTTIVLLCVLLVAALTVMRSGFVALTSDRVTLLVNVTGETKPELVRWAPPNQPAREENLITHHVIFLGPDGRPVGEVWMYGDEVAVKGRVLRLSPFLNAAGIPNLYELLFAHNGYRTVERYNAFPHMAVPLSPLGSLTVHPWLRPLLRRIMDRWMKTSSGGSIWDIKAVSDESTYYPLIDAEGKAMHQTFLLVLTPGGFSTSRSPSGLDEKQDSTK